MIDIDKAVTTVLTMDSWKVHYGMESPITTNYVKTSIRVAREHKLSSVAHITTCDFFRISEKRRNTIAGSSICCAFLFNQYNFFH